MVHFHCLVVAFALFYEANAGPCRPHGSSGIVSASSTDLTDNTDTSTVLSTKSSDVLAETTLSAALGLSTTTSLSTSMILSTYSTLGGSSDTTLTYGSSVSTDLPSVASTYDLSSSVGEIPSSDTSDASASVTTVSHLASENISSISTSDEAFSGKETNTAETISSETTNAGSSTAEMTTSKDSTASTMEEVLPTTTTTAENNEPTNYFINGGFEIPDENGEYTGAPSVPGSSGVTIKTDSSKALSGSRYVEINYPATYGTIVFRQLITNLDPAKRYVYTYNYAPADMVALSALASPAIQFSTLFGAYQYEANLAGQVSPQESYVKRKIVFGGMTSNWLQTRVLFSGVRSGSVRFDDISIIEYDPPCTLISPTPNDKWCNLKGSVYAASNVQKTIGAVQDLSLEDCAQSCLLESTCQVFSYVPNIGNNVGRCWRYKVAKEDIEYTQNTGAQFVYEPGCFSFKV